MGHPTKNQLPISPELANRLAPRILKTLVKREDGCWVRTTCLSPTGYSHINGGRDADGRRRYYSTHRLMYVYAYGPIPDGMTVDHTCEVASCCNPDHLRIMPHGANVLRSFTNPYAINARKELCIRGHNLESHPSRPGTRFCRECARARQREYAARRRMRGTV